MRFFRAFVLCVVGVVSAAPVFTASAAPAAKGAVQTPAVGKQPDWVIAVHGGAGVKPRVELPASLEAQYRAGLSAALEAGAAVLSRGGDGPEAIEAALKVLEDSPLFNAGRGAALDTHGNARHDASIMRGDTMDAGAVAGSSRIRNPITAARAVMERTENVLIHGEGADWFAAEQGLALADPLYYQTPARRAALLKKRAENPGQVAAVEQPETAFGTVGAVVLDRAGNISAGTSTGGRTNKRYGRVGDSPVIGAGTYASNGSCAVSATGHGEFFMRYTVARDICARLEFGNESLAAAAEAVMMGILRPAGGKGAVIAIDPRGQVVFAMNHNGMYRGVMSSALPARTAIYAHETVK
ncbi:isoaspartyl peptidase/L-asparaginase [Exilibacterium tricleocarpae]|uniref:Isoaspartyl peptidase n=1 Tax=Exilibacterium tricleocarpae TaxID=2591008 RepID=A0A545UBH2_9GAMM|nr:isoaspartyl peptidase/L-asparaginase [Exilibacterium tricleocarpae]TQV86807.1 isoaspartyl peptidase/L-asparaginase [Exilibacterium tricleocarpae]